MSEAKTAEQYFSDWEGHVFGFGYGTGEPHIIPLVRAFLSECNRNGGTSYDYEEQEIALGKAQTWFVINALGHADIIEYGTSPRYGWLTRKGEALKAFMLSRTDEDLIRIACSGEELGETCYPDVCNCGPNGYEEGRVCANPFWNDDAARAALSQAQPQPSDEVARSMSGNVLNAESGEKADGR